MRCAFFDVTNVSASLFRSTLSLRWSCPHLKTEAATRLCHSFFLTCVLPLSFSNLPHHHYVASTTPSRMPLLELPPLLQAFPPRSKRPYHSPRHSPQSHEQAPKSPHPGTDRARLAPPRPRSTAPHEYQPHRHEPPPPMPAPPRGHGHGYGSGYGEPSSPSTSRRSMDTPHRAAPPMHRPVPTHAHAQPAPERNYTFAPPDRPASAMAGPSSSQQQQGNLEWMPPRLKWVKKKERVSHFTPPSQYQGTSFRQYVHDGVSTRPNNP
ncbi:hypothetical protein C8R47DRAFT_1328973 [Mycena vitilis]|nr:hypothetical protein C8R47DRAFT_1328973 [Mycena vitilis]